ncbi:hypothetical protein EMIT0P12_20991 [Pseudomonas sp. IT-P12]
MMRGLFLAQGDLLGRAEGLAAHAFGNLLDLATGLEESSNLVVDRFAGFNGWSWLCFAVGCFYAHGGQLPVENQFGQSSYRNERVIAW